MKEAYDQNISATLISEIGEIRFNEAIKNTLKQLSLIEVYDIKYSCCSDGSNIRYTALIIYES